MIVEKKSFKNSSQGLTTNTMSFVSNDGGEYRVTAYLSVVALGASGNIGLHVDWVDDSLAVQNFDGDFINYDAIGYSQCSFMVTTFPGVAINMGFRADSDSMPIGSRIDAIFVLESLSAPQF